MTKAKEESRTSENTASQLFYKYETVGPMNGNNTSAQSRSINYSVDISRYKAVSCSISDASHQGSISITASVALGDGRTRTLGTTSAGSYSTWDRTDNSYGVDAILGPAEASMAKTLILNGSASITSHHNAGAYFILTVTGYKDFWE